MKVILENEEYEVESIFEFFNKDIFIRWPIEHTILDFNQGSNLSCIALKNDTRMIIFINGQFRLNDYTYSSPGSDGRKMVRDCIENLKK